MNLARRSAVAAVVAMSALAWAYVIWLSRAMDMTGLDPSADMGAMLMPAFKTWAPADFAFMLAMWSVMMVAMMLPTVMPMIMLYQRVARSAHAQGHAFAPPIWFAGGYVLAWLAFAAAATVLQWVLDGAVLLTPGMAAANNA